MDTEMTTDILIRSCTHLTEAKSHGPTHILIHEAFQAGKFWDEIKGILRLKLCNPSVHTYTSHFMEIQQKNNDTLAFYVHHSKTVAKQYTLNNDTVVIHIFVKGHQDAHTTTATYYHHVYQPCMLGMTEQ